MKKSNLSCRTHLLRIAAILCLLSSYLWIAPSQIHALSAGFRKYYALGNEEQTYVTADATADNQVAYYDRWKSGYEAGLRSSVFASGGESLWSTDPLQTDRLSLSISKGDVPQAPGESNPSAPLRAPTLAVDIVSSPWATVDHNSTPGTGDGELPQVFVVEAVITNTGAITDVAVHLDFNSDDDWMLLGAEDPDRIAEDLAPGTPYHAYWLVQYPHLHTDIGATHQYTVTAAPVDDPADSVAASATVTTRGTLGPTNQEMTYASAEVVVGVAFTVTVGFDFGTKPDDVVFSPVGNPDFEPGNYRLLASEVRFHNDDETWQEIVPDRLYFPTLDSSAENAEVTYTFLALTPESSRLCPYAGIRFGSNPKYDKLYCSEGEGTIISIEGEVFLSLTKQASSSTIQQGQPLTYTIYYTNTGDQPLSYVWIWDDVDTDSGSIINTSINPPSDPGETTDSRVAWYLGDIGSSDQVTSTGTLTFTILIDGDNQYLADHPLLVNHAFLGINPGSLPENVVLTSTVTTTIQVPVLTITKSDFPDPVLTGRLITYTLHYTNSGSAPATNVLITDVVPSNTTYQGCSGGSTCGMSNGVVSWNIGTVPSNTNNATVSFSVLVSDTLETGTLIRNEDYGIFSDQTGFIPGPLVTTTASREAAFIDGYAFQDDDCDGFHDTGEGGLSGIAVTLPSATVPVATTDGNGYYHFRVEIQEPVSVTAALPTGYFRTTPGTVFLESTFGITQTVNFGYALTDSTCGVIYGTVFEDVDHDGVQSGGEYGLSGVTVTSAEATTSPVTTDQFGQYTFRYNASGAVTIVETNPPFYVSTTPDVVHTSAVIGSSGPSPIDFGDFLGIKVTGQVFDDVNVNGVNDDGAGVSGATVAANGDNFTTGSSGVYTLYVTVSDSNPITVNETDPAGYVSTNAIPGAGMSKVDANTLRIDSPISGTVYSGGDFGDVLASQVIMDILVVKEANVTEAKVGETITYSYQVTNKGNVTLDPVTLSDDRLGSITLGSTSLAPDARTSGTATYEVQESDLPGPLTNMATVTGVSLIGSVTDTDSESVTLSEPSGIYLPIILRNY